MRDIFINLGGQDDNLGDSVLRAAYFSATRGPDRRFHVLLETATSDYASGLPLLPTDHIYSNRSAWVASSDGAKQPVHLFHAGEINPLSKVYPPRLLSAPLDRVIAGGGKVIFGGLGLRNPVDCCAEQFAQALREALVASWRDVPSRDAAGFGDVAPDWAFALGPRTSEWNKPGSRPLLAVTLRFDRPWPHQGFFDALRALASETSTRIVTVAQVARDAPHAVRLAEELGGEYLVAPSTRHSDLGAHVRAVYAQSLAVVSDRAHALIIGATEGAYPVGSASDPGKIKRLLAAAGLSDLTGGYDDLVSTSEQLESKLATLGPAVETARADVERLATRIQDAITAS